MKYNILERISRKLIKFGEGMFQITLYLLHVILAGCFTPFNLAGAMDWIALYTLYLNGTVLYTVFFIKSFITLAALHQNMLQVCNVHLPVIALWLHSFFRKEMSQRWQIVKNSARCLFLI